MAAIGFSDIGISRLRGIEYRADVCEAFRFDRLAQLPQGYGYAPVLSMKNA
jgi:hypothetical protein